MDNKKKEEYKGFYGPYQQGYYHKPQNLYHWNIFSEGGPNFSTEKLNKVQPIFNREEEKPAEEYDPYSTFGIMNEGLNNMFNELNNNSYDINNVDHFNEIKSKLYRGFGDIQRGVKNTSYNKKESLYNNEDKQEEEKLKNIFEFFQKGLINNEYFNKYKDPINEALDLIKQDIYIKNNENKEDNENNEDDKSNKSKDNNLVNDDKLIHEFYNKFLSPFLKANKSKNITIEEYLSDKKIDKSEVIKNLINDSVNFDELEDFLLKNDSFAKSKNFGQLFGALMYSKRYVRQNKNNKDNPDYINKLMNSRYENAFTPNISLDNLLSLDTIKNSLPDDLKKFATSIYNIYFHFSQFKDQFSHEDKQGNLSSNIYGSRLQNFLGEGDNSDDNLLRYLELNILDPILRKKNKQKHEKNNEDLKKGSSKYEDDYIYKPEDERKFYNPLFKHKKYIDEEYLSKINAYENFPLKFNKNEYIDRNIYKTIKDSDFKEDINNILAPIAQDYLLSTQYNKSKALKGFTNDIDLLMDKYPNPYAKAIMYGAVVELINNDHYLYPHNDFTKHYNSPEYSKGIINNKEKGLSLPIKTQDIQKLYVNKPEDKPYTKDLIDKLDLSDLNIDSQDAFLDKENSIDQNIFFNTLKDNLQSPYEENNIKEDILYNSIKNNFTPYEFQENLSNQKEKKLTYDIDIRQLLNNNNYKFDELNTKIDKLNYKFLSEDEKSLLQKVKNNIINLQKDYTLDNYEVDNQLLNFNEEIKSIIKSLEEKEKTYNKNIKDIESNISSIFTILNFIQDSKSEDLGSLINNFNLLPNGKKQLYKKDRSELEDYKSLIEKYSKINELNLDEISSISNDLNDHSIHLYKDINNYLKFLSSVKNVNLSEVKEKEALEVLKNILQDDYNSKLDDITILKDLLSNVNKNNKNVNLLSKNLKELILLNEKILDEKNTINKTLFLNTKSNVYEKYNDLNKKFTDIYLDIHKAILKEINDESKLINERDIIISKTLSNNEENNFNKLEKLKNINKDKKYLSIDNSKIEKQIQKLDQKINEYIEKYNLKKDKKYKLLKAYNPQGVYLDNIKNNINKFINNILISNNQILNNVKNEKRELSEKEIRNIEVQKKDILILKNEYLNEIENIINQITFDKINKFINESNSLNKVESISEKNKTLLKKNIKEVLLDYLSSKERYDYMKNKTYEVASLLQSSLYSLKDNTSNLMNKASNKVSEELDRIVEYALSFIGSNNLNINTSEDHKQEITEKYLTVNELLKEELDLAQENNNYIDNAIPDEVIQTSLKEDNNNSILLNNFINESIKNKIKPQIEPQSIKENKSISELLNTDNYYKGKDQDFNKQIRTSSELNNFLKNENKEKKLKIYKNSQNSLVNEVVKNSKEYIYKNTPSIISKIIKYNKPKEKTKINLYNEVNELTNFILEYIKPEINEISIVDFLQNLKNKYINENQVTKLSSEDYLLDETISTYNKKKQIKKEKEKIKKLKSINPTILTSEEELSNFKTLSLIRAYIKENYQHNLEFINSKLELEKNYPTEFKNWRNKNKKDFSIFKVFDKQPQIKIDIESLKSIINYGLMNGVNKFDSLIKGKEGKFDQSIRANFALKEKLKKINTKV